MSYIKYTKSDYKDLKKQHNIMCLIGNGFDIGILTSFNHPVKTSYENFFYFLQYQNCPKDNLIFQKMHAEKDTGNELWSDFETSLISLVEDNVEITKLEIDLRAIQVYFSRFLNIIITPDLLAKLGEESEKNNWALDSLNHFLQDFARGDYYDIVFPSGLDHYDLYNFVFFNFNYTSLFDNYIYLDKMQFNPRPYKHADRNFVFYRNPNSYDAPVNLGDASTVLSSYVVTNIVHPHGLQNIPRSILFGFNDKKQIGTKQINEKIDRFSKPYWGQNDIKYKYYFEDTGLFIIFGHSIGITDKWWWEHIVYSLCNNASELIIYRYDTKTITEIGLDEDKIKFINKSGVDLDDSQKSHVLNKIYIINFNDNIPRKLFNYSRT